METKNDVKMDVVDVEVDNRASVDEKKLAVDEKQKIDDPTSMESEPWLCYRRESDNVLMWSGLTCTNWGWVTLVFLIGYALLTAMLAILLVAEFEEGLNALWGYFTVFVVFVFILSGVVALGEYNRYKTAKIEEAERKKKTGLVFKHH
ncbi:hypothetical protein AAMO2058_000506600 [Amorphochlora amoebiformis]